jgi:lipopolysaccharide transport system permease protein
MWSTRWLLWQWTRRDFIVQYRQSLLGLAWAVVQPLLLLGLYGIIFARVLKVHATEGNYLVFALCGLSPWTFLSTALNRSSASLLGATAVIRQVYFPRAIVPLASIGMTTIDLLLSTAILLVTQLATAGTIHLSTLALVPIYLGLFLLMAGICIFVALIGALVRDVRFIIPLVIQIGFIATPIMYPRTLVPHHYAWLYNLNPIGQVINAVRSAVILGRWPSVALLGGIIGSGAVVLALGLWYADAVEDRLPDLL